MTIPALSSVVSNAWPAIWESTKTLTSGTQLAYNVGETTCKYVWAAFASRISPQYFGLEYIPLSSLLLSHYITLFFDPAFATAGTVAFAGLGQAQLKYNVEGVSKAGKKDYIWQDLGRTSFGITFKSKISTLVVPALVSNLAISMGGVVPPLPTPPYNSGDYYNGGAYG